MKGLTVTKIVKEIKFEGVWGKLESKKGFQRQSVLKYLRLTLGFMCNRALREKNLIANLGSFLLALTKCAFLQGEWALGYHSNIT